MARTRKAARKSKKYTRRGGARNLFANGRGPKGHQSARKKLLRLETAAKRAAKKLANARAVLAELDSLSHRPIRNGLLSAESLRRRHANQRHNDATAAREAMNDAEREARNAEEAANELRVGVDNDRLWSRENDEND